MTTRRRTTPPALEKFYDVKAATVRLGLADEDPADQRGQRMLRDGVNREHNSFPHHRLGRRLMFSESNLAVIASMLENPVSPYRRRNTKSRSTSRLATAA
ncbi:hypothetical protein ACODT3_10500 [Streptomyces sp. 4.24]|uniref:hypothetical protein n=1 Tax=Streptomyces tritrimontium TaxID=3406573 RepID=UPI003BB4BFBC